MLYFNEIKNKINNIQSIFIDWNLVISHTSNYLCLCFCVFVFNGYPFIIFRKKMSDEGTEVKRRGRSRNEPEAAKKVI